MILVLVFFNLQVSNIIYLDSPCGVGFSYSENASKYITGDLQTAADTHIFLLKVNFTHLLRKKIQEIKHIILKIDFCINLFLCWNI